MYVATMSFAALVEGRHIVVKEGVTRVRGDDPILVGRESFFKVARPALDSETTMAAPGERRGE